MAYRTSDEIATGQTSDLTGNAWVETISPRAASPVYFSHSQVNQGRKLAIYGVNAIQWVYQLKTASRSTYGGEVVQILGASAGPLQVGGNTRSYIELERIRSWFEWYMAKAGGGGRTQEPVLFEYPERGWAMYIMPTQFGPWEISADTIANEWSMIAEIVVESDRNELVQHTMDRYTRPLTHPTFASIAFDPNNPAINPSASIPNFRRIGAAYDQLIAQATTGVYGFFGNDVSRGIDDENADDTAYTEAWGTPYLIPPDGSGSTSAGATGDTSTKNGIINTIVSVFEAAGIPGQYGVAVASIESAGTWDPNIVNSYGYMGLFQTQASGRGGGTSHKDQVKAATEAIKNKLPSGAAISLPEVTQHYPAQSQIEDAAEWTAQYKPSGTINKNDLEQMLQWVFRAQGLTESPSDQATYRAIWPQRWQAAGKLIEEAAKDAATVIDGEFAKPIKEVQKPVPFSPFGQRWGRLHAGVDLAAPVGTPIFAAQAGTITKSSSTWDTDGYGSTIVLETGNHSFLYAHLSARDVREGDRVAIGQQLGLSGGAAGAAGAGSSQGPHLHFEMHTGSYTKSGANPQDPWPVFGKFFQ